MSHRFTQMNTDKFALSSSGWPLNQLARQPVPPQRMGEGGSFPGHRSLGGGGSNGRSVLQLRKSLFSRPENSRKRTQGTRRQPLPFLCSLRSFVAIPCGYGASRAGFICADLWQKRQVKGLLATFEMKNDRIFPLAPAYSRIFPRKRGRGLACRTIKSPSFLPNPSFGHQSEAKLQVKPRRGQSNRSDEGSTESHPTKNKCKHFTMSSLRKSRCFLPSRSVKSVKP
jgi:hypothetical protein